MKTPKNIAKAISLLVGTHLDYTPIQNKQIQKEDKENKRRFFKGFTNSTLQAEKNLIANNYKLMTKTNNVFHKEEQGMFLVVALIEGDVHLSIFLDRVAFEDYKKLEESYR